MGTKKKKHRLPPRIDRLPGEGADGDEARLFLQEVEQLEVVPDKDESAEAQGTAAPQRLKIPRRKVLVTDDRLDLHGMKLEEARLALARFVGRARGEGLSTVLVVTGKGSRSPGGVGVLKRELERWVLAEGATSVRAYAEAPRALGGAGAYVLYLR